MNKILSIAAISALATMGMTSCSNFEDVHNYHYVQKHEDKLSCNWNWPKNGPILLQSDLKNDVVTVLAVRKENIYKYCCETLRPNDNTWTEMTYHEFPTKPEDWTPSVIEGENKFKLGVYDILSFNSNGGKRYTIDYTKFLETNHDYFNTLWMTLNTFTNSNRADDAKLHPYHDIMDREENRSAEFIPPFSNDIFYSYARDVEVSESLNGAKAAFENYGRVTQDIVLAFSVMKAEADIRVNYVRGVITGAIASRNITTTELNTDKTYSTLFTINVDDDFTTRSLRPSITIPVFGLLHGTPEAGGSAPCVLRVYLDISYKDAAGKTQTGTIAAEYPLNNILNERPSVKFEDGVYKSAASGQYVIVPKTLQITGAGIITPEESEEDEWEELD
ncbi:MAG: hypothetical protein HUK00_02815 [Bacteroidaceae bacterium]|nr:hypothetical protein [Bacteroidaceae bacterium]